MNRNELQAAITDIEAKSDLLEKAMKLAGVVTSLFCEAGWNLVVVGGSAVEFYTEGAYMSGAIDFCRKNLERIPKKMLAACLAGQTEVDWNEVERLATLTDFDIVAELAELKQEVADELKRKRS